MRGYRRLIKANGGTEPADLIDKLNAEAAKIRAEVKERKAR